MTPGEAVAPIAATRLLEEYFSVSLGCKFFLGEDLVHPHEVFDEDGMLYAFAMLADARAQALSLPRVVREIDYSPMSMLGYRVVLEEDLRAMQMTVLVQSAEEVFGVSPGASEHTVQMGPLVEYLMMEPDERSKVSCPWARLQLLN